MSNATQSDVDTAGNILVHVQGSISIPIVNGRPGHTPYAFLCFDQWDDQWEEQPGEDEKGEPLAPKLAVAAGERFGVRHDQLTMFLLSAVAQRLLGRA